MRARAAGELVVGSWGGVWDDTVTRSIIDPLVAETGASVSILPGNSTEQFAKLLANRDAPPFDVLYIDLDVALPGFAQGMFETLVSDGIPNLSTAYGSSIYGDGQAVAASFGGISIIYNGDQVPSVDSWAVFSDAAHSGKFALPNIDGWALHAVSAFGKLRGKDENDIEAGWAEMTAVAPRAALMVGDFEARQVFERGEINFAAMYSGEAYVMYAAGQTSVRLAKPKEGMVAIPNLLAIPKNARNPELAHKFVDYALAKPAQLTFAQEYASAPSVDGVALDESLVPWMPFGEAEMSALVRPDWGAINERRDELTQRWNEEIVPIVGTE
jgi:putative spermidine/putrescine transport system substrate-binding protein